MTRSLPHLPLLLSLVAAGSAGAAAPKPVDAPLLVTKWTAADLAKQCEQAEKTTDDKLKALVAIPDAKRTFADSFESYDAIVGDYGELVARLSFMKDIHPDAAVRDAGAACEERAGKYAVALSARKDLYLAMKGFLDNAGKDQSKLDDEQKRLIELTMLDFKKSGLELSDADREKLIALRQQITELQTKYQKALNDDATTFEVKEADLAGLTDDFKKAHATKEKPGSFTLNTKYPDYYSVMENCSVEATRKKMETAFMNRGGKDNAKLLDQAAALRAQSAKLLGFPTHTDFVVADRMAKDQKTVGAFLARMKKSLEPGLDSDRKKMQALKAEETKNKAAVVNTWDWRYYMNQIKKRDYAVDDEAMRAYFPADKVMAGMFQVYSTLLGIDLVEVKKGVNPWADGVKLYEVKDKASKQSIAKFYVDLYPRDGKYGHAAEFTLSSGHGVLKNGKVTGYRIPVAALVVNFQPPQNGKPSMLSPKEVETLFHEFGHVMHETLTTARYTSMSGTRTALDFVEAPSQMLENWMYQPEVLALISADPADPKKPLPAELGQKLNAARKYNAGVHYSRQLFLGSFDQAVHTAEKVDSDAVAKKLWADIMKLPEDKDAHFAGTFGHMMGGYDGGYYGYLWSEVFAADMFTRFQKDGVLNPTVGKEYRDRVLARGRVVDAGVLLKDFLGREPNETAFLHLAGIAPATPAAGSAPPAKSQP